MHTRDITETTSRTEAACMQTDYMKTTPLTRPNSGGGIKIQFFNTGLVSHFQPLGTQEIRFGRKNNIHNFGRNLDKKWSSDR